MQRGEGGLSHACWQPLPGAGGALFFPYIRKIDTLSSNSYCIATGGLVIVIDPGGFPDQAEDLARAIRELPQAGERTVLFLLTHAHIDHCRVLMDSPVFSGPQPPLVAVQEEGALALAAADSRFTQATLLGIEPRPLRAAARLFGTPGDGQGMARDVACGGSTIHIATRLRSVPGGVPVPEQTLSDGGPCPVVLFPTPGHSPDSICIRIGSVLFIGDLLFAANPGVAGLYGWDRDALLASIDLILSLLREGTITHCCPGHGKILTASEAKRALAIVKKDASVLDGIEQINPGRARDTALYAEGLMDEIGAIFTIIASRLIFVSHVLEELEEGDEAEGISALIDADRIDTLLDEFHYFLTDYRAGSTMDIHLALKAGQIVQKLDRMVVQENLGLVLDPDYLRRVRRLISDYTTVHRGFRPPRALQPVPVAPLVCGFIDRLKHGGPTDDDLIGTADDPAAFSRALVRRIARVTVFDSVSCTLSDLPLLPARTDPVLLTDVIRTILEDIAGTGTEAITVSVTGDSTKISVTITCEDKIRVPVASDLRKRFLAGECLRAGGTIAWSTGFVPSVRIDLPVFVDAI